MLQCFIKPYRLHLYFSVAGDRDLTRPEYVVSDMLRPLPDLDWTFETADEAAAGDVHPAVFSVSDCQSNCTMRPSCEAFVGHEDADAASHVFASDDSFSSGNEGSPGGFRKRHSISPFHPRVDKKSLQESGCCGHTSRHSDLPPFQVGRGTWSDSSTVVPPVYTRGRGLSHGRADHEATVRSAAFRGRGRGVLAWSSRASRSAEFHPPAPVRLFSTDAGVLHEPSHYDASVGQLQPECRVNAAASEGDLRGNVGQQHDMRQIRSGPSHVQVDGQIHTSSATGGDSSTRGRWQCVSRPRSFRPLELSASNGDSESDFGQTASVSSAAGACAADIGHDSSSECELKFVRQGSLMMLLEDSDDIAADGHTDARVDADEDLIQFESPVRCVQLSGPVFP